MTYIIFYSVFILTAATAWKYAPTVTRVWAVQAFSALAALYAGIAFIEIAAESDFSLSAPSAIIISAFTLSPLILSLLLIKIFSLKTVNQQRLTLESLEIKSRLEAINTTTTRIFYACYIFSLVDMVRTGNFFRAYYVQSVGGNDTTTLLIAYTVGVLACCTNLLAGRRLIATVVFLCLFTLGKKHPIIYCVILPLIWSMVYSKVSSSRLLLAIPILFILLYIVAALFAGGRNIPVFLQLASTFDYAINFQYFLENFRLGSSEGEIFISSFIKFIPRFFWEEKPVVYGFLLIHQEIFYNEMGTGFFPSVFEEYATWLADFGYAGIVPFTLLKAVAIVAATLRRLPTMARFYIMLFLIDGFLCIVLLFLISIKKISFPFLIKSADKNAAHHSN